MSNAAVRGDSYTEGCLGQTGEYHCSQLSVICIAVCTVCLNRKTGPHCIFVVTLSSFDHC